MEGGHSGRRQRNTVFILVLEVFVEGSSGRRREGAREGGKGEGGDQKEVKTDLHAIANVGEEHRHIFSDRHRRNHLEQIIFSSSCLLDTVSCREEERRLGYPWHPTPWHSCTQSAEQSDVLHRVRGSAEHCGGNFRSPTPEGRI